MPKLKKWWPALLTGALFLIIFALSQLIPEQTAHDFIDSAGAWGPVVVFLLLLTSYIIAPINASPILFAGYYAYGTNVIFIAALSGSVSFVINFWIARRWGRDYVQKLIGPNRIKKLDKITENYGLPSLFFLRFLQGGLHDFVSYTAGLTSMRFTAYIVVSLVGEALSTLLWYIVISQVGSPTAFTVVTIIMTISLTVIFSVAMLAGRIIKKKSRERKSFKV